MSEPSTDTTAESRIPQASGTGGSSGAAILFLIAHLGVFVWSLLIGTVMSTGEPCPPPECYGERWTNLAVALLIPLSAVALLADLVISVALLARRRPEPLAPILGCVTQGVLLATAIVTASVL